MRGKTGKINSGVNRAVFIKQFATQTIKAKTTTTRPFDRLGNTALLTFDNFL
jgi:hypothetical protein